VEYADSLREVAATDPELARELGPLRTLEHVLDWIKRRGLDLAGLDVVQQDEYCHDAVVPLGPGPRHVAFGMT